MTCYFKKSDKVTKFIHSPEQTRDVAGHRTYLKTLNLTFMHFVLQFNRRVTYQVFSLWFQLYTYMH